VEDQRGGDEVERWSDEWYGDARERKRKREVKKERENENREKRK